MCCSIPLLRLMNCMDITFGILSGLALQLILLYAVKPAMLVDINSFPMTTKLIVCVLWNILRDQHGPSQ